MDIEFTQMLGGGESRCFKSFVTKYKPKEKSVGAKEEA
jgi:hypothetical protein